MAGLVRARQLRQGGTVPRQSLFSSKISDFAHRDFFALILIFKYIAVTLIVKFFGVPLDFEVTALLSSPWTCPCES